MNRKGSMLLFLRGGPARSGLLASRVGGVQNEAGGSEEFGRSTRKEVDRGRTGSGTPRRGASENSPGTLRRCRDDRNSRSSDPAIVREAGRTNGNPGAGKNVIGRGPYLASFCLETAKTA